MHRRRRVSALKRSLVLAATGLALVTAFALQACRSAAPDDFGSAGAAIAPSGSPGPSLGNSRRPEPGASARSGEQPEVPIQDGRPQPATTADAPTRLRIPAVELDASIDAVGIDASTGDLAVPPHVDEVGWYRYGPGFSASTGSIVIAGHVDSAAEGKGAFSRLGSLTEGDVVTLSDAQGRSRAFAVVARETYRKSAIPLSRYFARDGRPQLALITCGGPFDSATRHYRDNVVVTAVPR